MSPLFPTTKLRISYASHSWRPTFSASHRFLIQRVCLPSCRVKMNFPLVYLPRSMNSQYNIYGWRSVLRWGTTQRHIADSSSFAAACMSILYPNKTQACTWQERTLFLLTTQFAEWLRVNNFWSVLNKYIPCTTQRSLQTLFDFKNVRNRKIEFIVDNIVSESRKWKRGLFLKKRVKTAEWKIFLSKWIVCEKWWRK